MPRKKGPAWNSGWSDEQLQKRREYAIAFYHKNKYRTRPGKLHAGRGMRGKWRLYDKNELGSLKILSRIDAHRARWWANEHRMALMRLNCAVCGNDRVAHPDRGGKCAVCYKTRQKVKRKRRVARLRAEGTWKAVHSVFRQRRRARIANAPGSGVTPAQWRSVLDFYGHKCLNCGGSPVTMDHVIPLALGGHHDPLNLQPLCHLCNSVKSATHIDYRPCAFMAYA